MRSMNASIRMPIMGWAILVLMLSAIVCFAEDRAAKYAMPLWPVARNGKWGYIDSKGKVVVPFEYESAWNFSEGLALVQKGGKWGFINEQGRVAIPFQHDYCLPFYDGWARADDSFIDKEGKQTLFLPGVHAPAFSEGFAVASPLMPSGLGWPAGKPMPEPGKPYYVDKAGKRLIIRQPGVATGADDALFLRDILDPDCRGDFREGLAKITVNGKSGFINSQGIVVIPIQYEDAWSFNDGCTAVTLDGRHFHIDREGNRLYDQGRTFDDAHGFFESRAAVKVDGKWGFIDKRADIVIEPVYDDVMSFMGGLAPVKVGDLWGYIDVKGQMAIPPRYAYAHWFLGELASVEMPGVGRDSSGAMRHYINRAGEEVWSPEK